MMKSKKTNYKFWHSPIALGLLFVILIFFGYKIIDLIKRERETAHVKGDILDNLEILQKKETSLLKDLARLETEEGKEEIIREKYPFVKNGEKMVTIVNESEKIISSSETEKNNHGFWNWIKGIFNK